MSKLENSFDTERRMAAALVAFVFALSTSWCAPQMSFWVKVRRASAVMVGMVSRLATSKPRWSGTLLDVAKSGGTPWSVSFEHVISQTATRPPSEHHVRFGGRRKFANLPRHGVLHGDSAKCHVGTVERSRRHSLARRSGFHPWGSRRAQNARSSHFALTLALAKGRSSSARLNTTRRDFVPSALSQISASLSVGPIIVGLLTPWVAYVRTTAS